jgi:hypothetical protein
MNDIENPTQQPLTPAYLLKESYGLYGEKFWALFRIALVPALLAYLWRYFFRFAIRQMMVADWIGFDSGNFARLIATEWINGSFYWVVNSFFFAAVATTVLGVADKENPAVSDAFTQARARIGALTVTALLCWTIFWMGRAVANYALTNALNRLHLRPGFYVLETIFYTAPLLLAGLLSRLALTVPVLMDKPTASLKEAMGTSVKKTEGWELFFMMFLVKSALLALGLYWLANHGLDWLWQRHMLTQTTYPWFARALYICIAAAVESPMFIAFSVLYRDSSSSREKALSAAAIE